MLECGPGGHALLVAEPDQRRKIARVAAVGMPGEAPFPGQVLAKACQLTEGGRIHNRPPARLRARQHIRYQIGQARQKIGAHARMESVTIGAAKGQKSQ